MDRKEINDKLISNMILNKINYHLKNLFFIYKNCDFMKKIKYFYIWKKNKMLIIALENEIKDKKKIYDKQINESNLKIKNLNKKKEDCKNEEQKLIISEQKKQEQKKNYTQSINDLNIKLKKLKKENESLDKEKDLLSKNLNNINVVTKDPDPKRQELENILKQEKENELIYDRNLQEFAYSFKNQLAFYEQKAKQIINEKKKKNSLEISGGGGEQEMNNGDIKANSKF